MRENWFQPESPRSRVALDRANKVSRSVSNGSRNAATVIEQTEAATAAIETTVPP
jgi:hypothetical protein